MEEGTEGIKEGTEGTKQGTKEGTKEGIDIADINFKELPYPRFSIKRCFFSHDHRLKCPSKTPQGPSKTPFEDP